MQSLEGFYNDLNGGWTSVLKLFWAAPSIKFANCIMRLRCIPILAPNSCCQLSVACQLLSSIAICNFVIRPLDDLFSFPKIHISISPSITHQIFIQPTFCTCTVIA